MNDTKPSPATSNMALIINPKARRNRGGGDARLSDEARTLGMDVTTIDDFGNLPALYSDMMAKQPGLVIVSGGDGTAHAVISLLAEKQPEDQMPLMALLPHGTTNVTALQTSMRKPQPAQLARIAKAFLGGMPDELISRRRSIRVANLVGQPPLHGYINATGAVASATLRCQTNMNNKGVTGNVAVALSLIGDLAKQFFSSDPEAGGLLTPIPIELRTQEGRNLDGLTLTVLISTLDRLVLGSRPFWNQTGEPLHVIRAEANPPGVFINLYRVMFGDKSRLPKSHFSSFSSLALTQTLTGDVLIDGEFYRADEKTPLEISAGPELRFVRL